MHGRRARAESGGDGQDSRRCASHSARSERESVGFDDRTWLDHNGYPHTAQMRLTERYRLVDADTLELTMTIVDPEFYAQPFQSDVKRFRRDRENEKAWDEQIYCVPSE